MPANRTESSHAARRNNGQRPDGRRHAALFRNHQTAAPVTPATQFVCEPGEGDPALEPDVVKTKRIAENLYNALTPGRGSLHPISIVGFAKFLNIPVVHAWLGAAGHENL